MEIDFAYINAHKHDKEYAEILLAKATGILDEENHLRCEYISKNYWCWSSGERGLVWIAVALFRGSSAGATELTGDPDGFSSALGNCCGAFARALIDAIALYCRL